jgi:hypothetical protein
VRSLDLVERECLDAARRWRRIRTDELGGVSVHVAPPHAGFEALAKRLHDPVAGTLRQGRLPLGELAAHPLELA